MCFDPCQKHHSFPSAPDLNSAALRMAYCTPSCDVAGDIGVTDHTVGSLACVRALSAHTRLCECLRVYAHVCACALACVLACVVCIPCLKGLIVRVSSTAETPDLFMYCDVND